MEEENCTMLEDEHQCIYDERNTQPSQPRTNELTALVQEAEDLAPRRRGDVPHVPPAHARPNVTLQTGEGDDNTPRMSSTDTDISGILPTTSDAPPVYSMSTDATVTLPMTSNDPSPGCRVFTVPQGTISFFMPTGGVSPANSTLNVGVPLVSTTPSNVPQAQLTAPSTVQDIPAASSTPPVHPLSNKTSDDRGGRKLPEVGDIPTFSGERPGVSGSLAPGLFIRKIEAETRGRYWTDSLRILLARKQLRGKARDAWSNKGGDTEVWETFKERFKSTFQVKALLNDHLLHTYAPPRKAGEEIDTYINRIYSYLDNFNKNGDMPENEKLANTKRILLQQLPQSVTSAMFKAAHLDDLIEGIEIAATAHGDAKLTPQAIEAEKTHAQKMGAKTSITAANPAVATASTGRWRGGDRRSQKTPPAANQEKGVGGRDMSGPRKRSATDNQERYPGQIKRLRPSSGQSGSSSQRNQTLLSLT